MATLFYLVSAVLMPLRELVLTVQGRSSWARWRLVCRHLLLALAMGGSAVATFRYLPRAVLPPDLTIGGVSSLLVTVVLFVAYLVVANVVALLTPRTLQLPQPKLPKLPDREDTVGVPAEMDLTEIDPAEIDLAEIDLAEIDLTEIDVAEIDLTDVEEALDQPERRASGVPADSMGSVA
jgi:hypothetical protein